MSVPLPGPEREAWKNRNSRFVDPVEFDIVEGEEETIPIEEELELPIKNDATSQLTSNRESA